MRRAVVLGVLAVALVISGCGDDTPTEYNAEVEENFIQTCTDQGGEDLQDVCQCAYEAFEENIPFERFQRVDHRRAGDPNAELPHDFLDLYPDCVIQAGGGSADTAPTVPPTTTTTVAGATTTAPAVTDTTVAP